MRPALFLVIFICVWWCTPSLSQKLQEQFIPLAEQQYYFQAAMATDTTQYPAGINSENGEIVYVNQNDLLAAFFPAACWQLFGLARDNMWSSEALRRMPDTLIRMHSVSAILIYSSAFEKTLDSVSKTNIIMLANQLKTATPDDTLQLQNLHEALLPLVAAEGLCKAYEINANEQYLQFLLTSSDKISDFITMLETNSNMDTLKVQRTRSLLAMVYALLYAYSEHEALLLKSKKAIAAIESLYKQPNMRQFPTLPAYIEQLIAADGDKLTLMLLLNTWKITEAAKGKINKSQMLALESEALACLYHYKWIADLRSNAFFVVKNKGMKADNVPIYATNAAILPDYYLLRFLSRPF